MAQPPGRAAQETVTLPPSRLYFTALESRFSSTCCSRWRSAMTWRSSAGSSSPSVDAARARPAAARGRARSRSVADSAPARARSAAARPRSAQMSSTSLIRASRWRPPLRMCATLSRSSRVERVHLEELGEAEDARSAACAARGSSARGTRSWRGSRDRPPPPPGGAPRSRAAAARWSPTARGPLRTRRSSSSAWRSSRSCSRAWEGDGDLRGRLARDAICSSENRGVAAEAQHAEQLAVGDHGDRAVSGHARGEQGLGLARG